MLKAPWPLFFLALILSAPPNRPLQEFYDALAPKELMRQTKPMKGLEKLAGHIASEDWIAAEKLLKRAATSRPNDASVLYNLGKVLMEQRKWPPARHWLKKAAAAAPNHQKAWFELGRTALELSDPVEALSAFQRATQLDPNDLDAQRNLGRVALRLGHFDVARHAFHHFGSEDLEAAIARYRIAAETGASDAADQRSALLKREKDRAHVIKALTRVSKGTLPLNL